MNKIKKYWVDIASFVVGALVYLLVLLIWLGKLPWPQGIVFLSPYAITIMAAIALMGIYMFKLSKKDIPLSTAIVLMLTAILTLKPLNISQLGNTISDVLYLSLTAGLIAATLGILVDIARNILKIVK